MKDKIDLRDTIISDLDNLFVIQLDKEANYLAAFTSKDPSNKKAYINKWTHLLANSIVNMQTIVANNTIAGSVVKYEMDGKAEITYWLDKHFWGTGMMTLAVQMFLEKEKNRPIYGRVAFDNFGSQRVLEKGGFMRIRTEKGFAEARNKEIEEFVYILE